MCHFKPDIVSLQFVPFSFHSKGLPLFLPKWLSGFNGFPVKWHFMFHELWVADSKAHSIKAWLVRELQKAIIKKLLKQFTNVRIATSNQAYSRMLNRLGFEVDVLPIFSNLPKGKRREIPHVSNRNEKIVGVFFGHLQENLQLLENVRFLSNAIETQLNKQLVILHIGNNRNPKTVELISQLATQLHIQTLSLGYLDAQEVADMLYSADIGLSNYPIDLINKSGTIASMLYNELPVILLAGDNCKRTKLDLSEVKSWYDSDDLNGFIHQKTNFSLKYDPKITAKKLEQKFLNQLNNNYPVFV